MRLAASPPCPAGSRARSLWNATRASPGGMFPASAIMKCSGFSRSPWSSSKSISGTTAVRRGTSAFATSTSACADSWKLRPHLQGALPSHDRALPSRDRQGAEPVELALSDPPRPRRGLREMGAHLGGGRPRATPERSRAATVRERSRLSSLYLIRHGQAGTRGHYDALSDLGKRQAYLLGQHLAVQKVPFKAFIAGCRNRQRQTAEEVWRAYREAGVAVPDRKRTRLN